MNGARIISLYRELKRRRLFRTSILYAVAAWGVVAAMDILLPQFVSDSEAAMRIVFMTVFLLFPVIGVFSWFYDLGETGIQRTPSFSRLAHDPGKSLHRIDYLTILLLLFVAAGILALATHRIYQLPAVTESRGDSQIVVMPFSTCADQADESLVAGGLVTELIRLLGEHEGLRVTTSRSRSDTLITLPGIQAGNRYKVNGEVCREDATLILRVSLSNERGETVWHQMFADDLQSGNQSVASLASRAASTLGRILGAGVPPNRLSQVKPLAYEQLLIGLQWRAHGDKDKAKAAFERALQYQPDYSEALLELGLLNLDMVGYHQETGIRQAMPFATEALSLALEKLEQGNATARTYFVAGKITATLARWESELLWRQTGALEEPDIRALKEDIRLKFAEAERYLRTALSLNPSATPTYVELANAIEQQGLERRREALTVLETGWARDPLDLTISARLAKRLAARGQFWQAIEILQNFNALPQVPSGGWWWQLELMTLNRYMDEKCETLINMLRNDPGAFQDVNNRWQAWWFLSDLAFMGLEEEAEAWRARLEDMPLEPWMRDIGLRNYRVALGQTDELIRTSEEKIAQLQDDETSDSYYEWRFAWSHGLALGGKLQEAIDLIEATRHAPGLWHEREMLSSLRLAALYLRAGNADKATPLLDDVVAYLETEVALGIRHPTTLAKLAFAYMHQGRQDDAINMLRKAVDYHWRGACDEPGSLGWYWPFAAINDDPRITEICDRMDSDVALQRERVRAMLAQHDPDELLAPLMTMSE